MEVLFFVNKFPNPSETFVLSQIVGLIDRGLDVRILAIERGDFNTLHGKVSQYDLLAKTTYINPSSQNNRAKFVIRLLAVVPKILSKTVVTALNVKKYGRHAKSLFLAYCAVKVKKQSADVIIAHFGTAAVAANKLIEIGVLKGHLLPIFHGSDISKKSILENYKTDYLKLFGDSSFVIPISNLWQSKLIDMGCPAEKIIVNRMGIDTKQFTFNPTSLNREEPLKMVTVARFVEKKGLEYAIEAMQLLKQRKVPFIYNIIGTGPLKARLEKMIYDNNLSDCVHFLGFKPQEEVRNILSQSNVFLLPSVTAENGDMEGIPVALMESMAQGLITISTYHSGIPELIDNDISGFLVKERNTIQIADVVERIINGDLNLEDIRKNAVEKIHSTFDQRILYDQLVNIVERCH
jgi:colanic acid/amylovoran biosynthesis glycosyltransferase